MATWTSDPDRDVLSLANLDKVRRALAHPDSLVFGWHYHYAGGSARSGVAYDEFGTYLDALQSAKAGDHFTLYDLEAVHHLAVAESVPTQSADRMRSDTQGVQKLRSLLADPHVELTMVVSGRQPSVEALDDLDRGSWEEIELLWVDPASHVVVFDGVLDHDADGIAVEAVTSPSGRSRRNALVDGKRPNEAGQVPSSGPY